MDDTDLRDALDLAIGDGPALPAAAERLPAARRALRRRRAGVAATAAAAVVAVVVPVAALAGGSLTSGVDPIGPPPASQDGAGFEEPWRDTYARYTRQGDLEIRPGGTVLDRVDDYLLGTRWTRSVALELRHDGVVRWVSAEWRRGESGSGWTEPGGDWTDFREWVAHEAADQGADPSGAVELSWDGDELVASEDVEILEQRADVDLGPAFEEEERGSGPGAALVVIAGDRMLVLYRQTSGEEGRLIAVLRNDRESTLDGLLAWARERFAAGEGTL